MAKFTCFYGIILLYIQLINKANKLVAKSISFWALKLYDSKLFFENGSKKLVAINNKSNQYSKTIQWELLV